MKTVLIALALAALMGLGTWVIGHNASCQGRSIRIANMIVAGCE